jgi:hypothetical protein
VADDFCQLTKQFEIAKCKDKPTNVMENQIFKCIKCGGRMVKGVNVDYTLGGNSGSQYHPSCWVKGEPINEKSILAVTWTH